MRAVLTGLSESGRRKNSPVRSRLSRDLTGIEEAENSL